MDITIRHRFGTRREAICNLKEALRDARRKTQDYLRQVVALQRDLNACHDRMRETDAELAGLQFQMRIYQFATYAFLLTSFVLAILYGKAH